MVITIPTGGASLDTLIVDAGRRFAARTAGALTTVLGTWLYRLREMASDGDHEEDRSASATARRLLSAVCSQEALLDALLPAQDAVYVKDREGRYEIVSAAGAEKLGVATGALVGRTDLELFAGQLGERLWRSDQQIMAAGEIRRLTEPLVVGGRLRTYLTTKAPLRDPSGMVVGLVGVSTDITSLSEPDEELGRREAQMAEAQALTRVGSWERDLQSGEQTWTDEIYRIVGRDRSQLAPTFEAFLDCVHPKDRKRLADQVDAASRPGADGSFALEHRIIRPDGSERICRCRGRVFRDPHGTPLRLIGAVQDLTGRRPASERLGRILNGAPEAFVAMDAAGVITEWNRAAEETFGWSRAEAIGHGLADLIIPPALRDAHWSGVRRFLATGESTVLETPVEFSAVHRDGRELPLLLMISALMTDSHWEFHAFLRDISDRTRYEAERDALIEKLDSLSRTDELTGLYNRRAWEVELARELARAAREGAELCVALLDLDAFKEYNDMHGHQAGDELLRAVSSSWKTLLRATDILARHGGEEFAIAFHSGPLDAAHLAIERLRSEIPAKQTFSAGLVAWDGQESAAQVVRRADNALYEAKRAGRNQTVTHP
jgi:diguanylate cyclase (GGDEF)-like protein/PAS domain S-box-containing protein